MVLRAFDLACKKHGLSIVDALQVLADVARTLSNDLDAAHRAIPDAAPELWSDRTGRKENPPAFVRRVYAPYLSGRFTRAMLRNLDPTLYTALAVWEHRHPDQVLTELPKRHIRPRQSSFDFQPD